MTTKQRAYLKSLAMTMDPIFQAGKNSLTPEFVKAVSEALEARDGEKWRQVTGYIITAITGIILGFIATHLGL